MFNKYEYNRQYAKSHRKRINELRRCRYFKNVLANREKEKIRYYTKRKIKQSMYRKRNRERFLQWKQKDSIKNRFKHAVWHAHGAKRVWSISKEDYDKLMQQPCYYCGNALALSGCGLDRIDNEKDYLLDNVVPCCPPCNMLRGRRLTPDETRVAALAIKQYRFGTIFNYQLSVN